MTLFHQFLKNGLPLLQDSLSHFGSSSGHCLRKPFQLILPSSLFSNFPNSFSSQNCYETLSHILLRANIIHMIFVEHLKILAFYQVKTEQNFATPPVSSTVDLIFFLSFCFCFATAKFATFTLFAFQEITFNYLSGDPLITGSLP